MTSFGEVRPSVPVGRQITAADMAAGEAESQFQPIAAGREALLATGCPWFDVAGLVKMRARRCGWPDEPTYRAQESHGSPRSRRTAPQALSASTIRWPIFVAVSLDA